MTKTVRVSKFIINRKVNLQIIIGFITLIVIGFSLANPFLFIDRDVFTKNCGYEAIDRNGEVSLLYRCGIDNKKMLDIWYKNVSIINSIMDPDRIYAQYPLSWDVSSFDYEGFKEDLIKIKNDVDTLSNVLIVAAEAAHRTNFCFIDHKIKAKIFEIGLIWMSALASGPLRYYFPTSYKNLENWSAFRHLIVTNSQNIIKYEFDILKTCMSDIKSNYTEQHKRLDY